MSDDDQKTEMAAMAGDTVDLPAEKSYEPNPVSIEDLINRHKTISAHKTTHVIQDIISDASRAGISEAEVADIFSEPLPKYKADAIVELKNRLVSLYESAKHRENDLEVYFSVGLSALSKLSAFDKKIQKFEPLLGEYLSLMEGVGFTLASRSREYEEAQHLQSMTDNWRQEVTNFIIDLQNSSTGIVLSEVAIEKLKIKKDVPTSEFKSLVKKAIAVYNKNRGQGEIFIHKHIPWVTARVQRYRNLYRANEILSEIPPESWDLDSREVSISDFDLENLKKFSEKAKGRIWFNATLDQLHWRKSCGIKDLARLTTKKDIEHLSQQGIIKSVKRKFRGLRPLGEDGLDFKKLIATNSHVKDGTAYQEGDIIYSYIQGRTRFDTKQAVIYYHHKVLITQMFNQLKKEFRSNKINRKPTAEDLAKEMKFLDVAEVGMYLG